MLKSELVNCVTSAPGCIRLGCVTLTPQTVGRPDRYSGESPCPPILGSVESAVRASRQEFERWISGSACCYFRALLPGQELRQKQHALDKTDRRFDASKGVIRQCLADDAPRPFVDRSESRIGVVPRCDGDAACDEKRVFGRNAGQGFRRCGDTVGLEDWLDGRVSRLNQEEVVRPSSPGQGDSA